MEMVDLKSVLDTPSCLLQGLGNDCRIYCIYGGVRLFRDVHDIEKKSVSIPLSDLDAVVKIGRRYCVLEERQDLTTGVRSWGFIRLQDQCGSIVTCVAFHYDPWYREYFCEVLLDQPKDRWLRLAVGSLLLSPHTPLAFQSLFSR